MHLSGLHILSYRSGLITVMVSRYNSLHAKFGLNLSGCWRCRFRELLWVKMIRRSGEFRTDDLETSGRPLGRTSVRLRGVAARVREANATAAQRGRTSSRRSAGYCAYHWGLFRLSVRQRFSDCELVVTCGALETDPRSGEGERQLIGLAIWLEESDWNTLRCRLRYR